MKFGVRLAVQGETGAPGAGFDYARQMAHEAEDAPVETRVRYVNTARLAYLSQPGRH